MTWEVVSVDDRLFELKVEFDTWKKIWFSHKQFISLFHDSLRVEANLRQFNHESYPFLRISKKQVVYEYIQSYYTFDTVHEINIYWPDNSDPKFYLDPLNPLHGSKVYKYDFIRTENINFRDNYIEI